MRGSKKDEKWSAEEQADWVSAARASGEAALAQQAKSLSNIRWRSTALAVPTLALLTFMGASFPNPLIAVALATLIAWALVVILFPFVKFTFYLTPAALLRWLDGDAAAPDYATATKTLLVTIDTAIGVNQKKLTALYAGYLALVALCGVALVTAVICSTL